MGIASSIEYLKEDGWTFVEEKERKELWKKDGLRVYLDTTTGQISDISPLNSNLDKLKSTGTQGVT